MNRADLPILAMIILGFFYFIDDYPIATLFLALLIGNVTRLAFRYQDITLPFTAHNDLHSITESPEKLFNHNDRDYPEWIEIEGEQERLYFLGMLDIADDDTEPSEVPDNCREIYYGAMYGTSDNQ